MSQAQSPISSTTPEALRAAIAEAVQVDAQQLQSAVGSIQVATSEQLQVTDPQIKSLYDREGRTLTLLADRIPAGQEVKDFAAALIYHLGQQAAGELLGDEGIANARKLLTVKVAVACRNASGSADMPVFDVKVSQEQYDLGEHYDMAETLAVEGGYEAPFVCFDRTESPALKSASAIFDGSDTPLPQDLAGIEHDARTALAASVMVQADHWYHHRHDLESEMVFLTADGVVKLDRRVPGDGTQWYVADWDKGWSCYDSTIEPGDLLSTPIENTPQAIEVAWAEYQQQSAQGAAAARAEPQGQLSNCAEQVDPLDFRIKRLAYVQEWSDALVQKALDCIGRELSADDVYGSEMGVLEPLKPACDSPSPGM